MSVLSVYNGPDGYSRNGTIYISNSVSIVWRKLLIEKSKLKVGQYYFDIGFGDDPFFLFFFSAIVPPNISYRSRSFWRNDHAETEVVIEHQRDRPVTEG